MKRTLVSSPNISNIDTLFEIYKSLEGNTDTTMTEFYAFLCVDSIHRRLFLESYCDYSFSEHPYAFVLMITPKA